MHRHTARRGATILTAALTTALLAAPALATTPGTGNAPDSPETEQGKLILLMDSSGSMGEPDDAGDPKIQAARAALDAVISGLGDDQQVGLRVFGANELGTSNPASCTDSQLVVPVGAGNRSELGAAVQDYEPFGETPIAYALQEAGQDLGSEGQRSILLVSDGLSTCDPDPCEVAADLSDDGIDLAIHVVGFDVDADAREELQCIAEAGNGQYFDATDTETLTSALQQVSTRAYRPFTITGDPVVGSLTSASDAPVLGAGQYTDTLPEREDETKHYRIPRTMPESTLHVGVTMRPNGGGFSSYRLSLGTVAGRGCGTDTATPWSAARGSSFGTAAVSSPTRAVCAEEDELVLRVRPGGSSMEILGEPLEIVVMEEPPVTNPADLPGRAAQPVWHGTQPSEPAGDVVPGSSLNDAPALEPGQTYSSEMTQGEIVFFRVPVEHGQRLEALVEFPAPSGPLADAMGPGSDYGEVTIIGPTRAEAHAVIADLGDLNRKVQLQDDRAVRAAATTPEVRYHNREGGTVRGASVAGDYFVGVSLDSNRDVTLPMPFTLTTETVGDVQGIPEYASPTVSTDDGRTADAAAQTEEPAGPVAGADDPAPTTEEPEPTEDSMAAAPVGDDAAPVGMLVGLGALGLALLGAGGFVLARVMRT